LVVNLLLVAMYAPPGSQRPSETEIHIAGPAGRLGGTLTLPAGASRVPIVITITGSGAHYRDGNRDPNDRYRPFRQIAERLSRCGIATLLLDDRGVGASDGDAASATLEDTAADVRAAIDDVRHRPVVDGSRVALIGHSYGGVVAPLVAAADPTIAAVVLLGGPATSFRETMRYQHRYRIAHDDSIPIDRKDAALEAAMRQQDLNVTRSTEAWRRSVQDRDPLLTARKLRMPVLILHGLTDRAVDPANAMSLEAAIREGGNQGVKRHLFPGLNHHFLRDPVDAPEGYAALPSQDLAPELLTEMCGWLSTHLR
jgi:hypothetical protein